jgi:hypothetical protein
MTSSEWTCRTCGQYNDPEASYCRFCAAPRYIEAEHAPPEQAVKLSTLDPVRGGGLFGAGWWVVVLGVVNLVIMLVAVWIFMG